VSSVREVAVKKHEDQSTTTTTVISDVRGPTAEEERVLRMRSGASLPLNAALGSKLTGVPAALQDELAARLRLIEAEALAVAAEEATDPGDDPIRSAKKDRIIAALRGVPEED